jgi:hypothetical protein
MSDRQSSYRSTKQIRFPDAVDRRDVDSSPARTGIAHAPRSSARRNAASAAHANRERADDRALDRLHGARDVGGCELTTTFIEPRR